MKSNEIIDPITEQQQRQVIAATHRCIDQASALYGREFKTVPVDFDLSGRCAGMYQVRGRARRIRFNPWLFAKYYQDSIGDTVIHEVAHYIVDSLYGLKRVKPHGAEWKKIMVDLGALPNTTGNYAVIFFPRRSPRGRQHARMRCTSVASVETNAKGGVRARGFPQPAGGRFALGIGNRRRAVGKRQNLGHRARHGRDVRG